GPSCPPTLRIRRLAGTCPPSSGTGREVPAAGSGARQSPLVSPRVSPIIPNAAAEQNRGAQRPAHARRTRGADQADGPRRLKRGVRRQPEPSPLPAQSGRGPGVILPEDHPRPHHPHADRVFENENGRPKPPVALAVRLRQLLQQEVRLP